jgi:hypothetical protein
VRKIIRAYFVKNGNRKWFHLLKVPAQIETYIYYIYRALFGRGATKSYKRGCWGLGNKK